LPRNAKGWEHDTYEPLARAVIERPACFTGPEDRVSFCARLTGATESGCSGQLSSDATGAQPKDRVCLWSIPLRCCRSRGGKRLRTTKLAWVVIGLKVAMHNLLLMARLGTGTGAPA